MKEVEFARELLKRMDENIFQMTMRKAATKGFIVQGFTRKLGSAPKKLVSASFERMGRNGRYQSGMFLDALCETNEETPLAQIARKWMLSGDYQIEAEQELEQMETEEEKRKEGVIKKEEKQEDVSLKQKKEEEEIVERQKAKIKKQQMTIQDLRIKIDNYEKEKKQLQKENRRLENRIEEEKNAYAQLKEENQRLKEKNVKFVEQIAVGEGKILNYKEIFQKAPRVLCFSKKTIDKNAFPFYNIEQLYEWNEDYETEINWRKYKQIWVIETEFSYLEVMKIKRLPCRKIVLSPNMKTLIERAEGGQ